ncbi:hypothetical protein NUACC21_01130 [Scytonema sp. NUACC21]
MPPNLKKLALSKALFFASEIQDQYNRANALSNLVDKLPPELLPGALTAARGIKDKRYRASVLSFFTNKLPELLSEALAAAREIQDKRYRANVLSFLTDKLPELLSEALAAAKEIQDEHNRAYALIPLAEKLPPELLSEALAAVRQIQDERHRAYALSNFAAHLSSELLRKTLAAALEIQNDDDYRDIIISNLSENLSSELLSEALASVRQIQDEYNRANALSSLAEKLPELLSEALAAAKEIQDEYNRADALIRLAEKLPPELLSEALAATREIQDEYNRANALSSLAEKLPPELLSEALAAALEIQDEYNRTKALSSLVEKLPPELLSEALAAAKEIQDKFYHAEYKFYHAEAVSSLVEKLPPELLSEALAAALEIQDEYNRTIGTQAATEILLSGLEKLEYRGYDSAGVATIWEGEVNCIRAKGKLYNLRSKLEQVETPAQIGIGHTRWATHGKPEEYNAHPHMDTAMRVAVVQNGIVENYRELREHLKARGCQFRSETDTEVIPHLIAQYLKEPPTPPLPYSPSPFLEAVRHVVNKLEGAFAIAVVCADYPDELIVVRQQAPLVIGFGQGEFFCASDTPAIVSHTRAVLPLENGEMARLTPLGVEIYNFAGERLKKQPRLLNLNPTMVEKQGFKHFMLKEIYEQPGVVRACLEAYFNADWNVNDSTQSPVNLGLAKELYADLEQIQIVACGTSWHAALVGKHLLEQVAGIATQVHYASEYRYAPSPMTANTLIIGVTQSGETADTLAALAMEKERRQGKDTKYQARLLGITNRPESSLGHMVPQIINTLAG